MATDRSNEARPVRILYTAEATVAGGRKGHGRTSDGRLAVNLSVPTELDGDGGPGTNPEQLFAVGYGACFHNALLTLARGRQLDMADSTITARVGFGPTGVGGFGLAVLTVDLVEHIRQEIRVVDFWRNQSAQNALRGWLIEHLDDHNIAPFTRLSALADQLVDLARTLHSRLVGDSRG